MPSCSLLHVVFPEIWTYTSILVLSNSLSCMYETEICTILFLTWDITSSLWLLILASCAEMARVLKPFPSSWWESQALLFIPKYPQERFPEGRFGLMRASPWDKEGDYNVWGVCTCGGTPVSVCLLPHPSKAVMHPSEGCQHFAPIPGLSTILQDGKWNLATFLPPWPNP